MRLFRVPARPHAALLTVLFALLVPGLAPGAPLHQLGQAASGVQGVGCLPAGGWIADAGLRLALWHADAGCAGGTWALTASGVAMLLASMLVIVALAAHGSRWAAGRLGAVPLRTAATPPVHRGGCRPADPPTGRTGRYPSERWVLRGPPAA